MSDIANLLAQLGLGKYVETFVANEVDLDALPHLSDHDLQELGLPLGPRRKLLAAIKAGPESARSLARLAKDAERRQLTVMFADLVGSTGLSRQFDPEEMGDLIGSYQSVISRSVARYDGHVAKLMGDGVLCYFGWPQAHEDDAERAVRAALLAVAETVSLRTPRGDRLSARIGIATGLVVVGNLVGEASAQENAVVGETPNLAARLQALAEPNSVVIADTTCRLVPGVFETIDLGQCELKGFADPVRAWRINGEAAPESRFDARRGTGTPLVGRTEELRVLLRSWRKAKDGKGQVALIPGESGIGKSRLIAALYDGLAADPHASLRYFCSPHHLNSSLYPVIRHIERSAGFQRGDNTTAKLDKLEAYLHTAISNIGEAGFLLASLLSIDATGRYEPMKLAASAQKARTLLLLSSLIKGLAARGPVIVNFEDVHWMDPTSAEWLDMLIQEINDLPVLLIVSFRPEFESRWPPSRSLVKLSLDRLDRRQGAAMIERVAGNKPLPSEVSNQILDNTEGVPLFIEELTKSVLESGLLADHGERYVLQGPLPRLAIPATLQDSLMARLDRLDAAKETAQIGACIGRVFHHRLLAAVTGLDDNRLKRILLQLESSELIFRHGIAPEASYAFKHALVQDIAYQSLLKSRRQQLHAHIASVLQTQFADLVDSEPETLARHFTAAILPEKAVAFWLKAGQLAMKRSANREAIAHLRKGIELLATLPDSEERLRQEIQLHAATGVALMAAKGWGAPDVLEALSKARVLSEKLGDKHQLFIALCGEASYHMISGNLVAADDLGRQCFALVRDTDESGLLLEAHHRQWATKFFMGDYRAAEQHTAYGLSMYDADRHHCLTYTYTGHDPGVCCRDYLAIILWLRGYPDRALALSHEAVALADRVAHPLSQVLARSHQTFVHLMRGEPLEALRRLEVSRPLANDYGLPAAEGQFQLGWALAESGQIIDGLTEMRAGIAAITATGAGAGMQYFLSVLARICGEAGECGEGLSLMDRALALADAGARYQLPELFRVKGELLQRFSPNGDDAEGWFTRAVELARDEGTKSLELRSALSLANLYRIRGRHNEARGLLEPVYNWFTEGLDTRDLLEAKRMLHSLH